MPWPVSQMNSSTAAAACVVARPTRSRFGGRPRIACSALSSRFSSACWIWLPSATTDGSVGWNSGDELDAVQPELVGAQRQDAARTGPRCPAGARAAAWRRANASRLRTIRAARSDSSAIRRRSLRQLGARPNALAGGVAHLLLQQLRVADHARERVVQFVRDAGDELADRRQLFRLEQLRLGRLQPLERRHRARVGQRELVAHLLHPARAAGCPR